MSNVSTQMSVQNPLSSVLNFIKYLKCINFNCETVSMKRLILLELLGASFLLLRKSSSLAPFSALSVKMSIKQTINHYLWRRNAVTEKTSF